MGEKTTTSILEAAVQTLRFARQGEQDYLEGGERRLSGFYNAVTNGRSVTFVLQSLKGRAPGWLEWYAVVQEKLRADPLAKYFHTLRSEIEKEGTHGTSTNELHIASLDLSHFMRDAPPNTKEAFIGDTLGRSGWNVELADGTIATVYFRLPETVGTSKVFLDESPDRRPIDEQLAQWLTQVDGILTEAIDTFATPDAKPRLLAALRRANVPPSTVGPFSAEATEIIRNALRAR